MGVHCYDLHFSRGIVTYDIIFRLLTRFGLLERRRKRVIAKRRNLIHLARLFIRLGRSKQISCRQTNERIHIRAGYIKRRWFSSPRWALTVDLNNRRVAFDVRQFGSRSRCARNVESSSSTKRLAAVRRRCDCRFKRTGADGLQSETTVGAICRSSAPNRGNESRFVGFPHNLPYGRRAWLIAVFDSIGGNWARLWAKWGDGSFDVGQSRPTPSGVQVRAGPARRRRRTDRSNCLETARASRRETSARRETRQEARNRIASRPRRSGTSQRFARRTRA